MIKEILLDCDGVLADFLSSALEKLNAKLGRTTTVADYVRFNNWNIHDVYGLRASEFWAIIEEGHCLWNNIKPFPWAKDLVKYCEQFGRVTIATTPSFSPECASQKTAWLRDNLGIFNDAVMIGGRKELMGKPGNFLIDDNATNVEKFIEAGGDGVVVPSNWNTIYFNFEDVRQVIANKLEWSGPSCCPTGLPGVKDVPGQDSPEYGRPGPKGVAAPTAIATGDTSKDSAQFKCCCTPPLADPDCRKHGLRR